MTPPLTPHLTTAAKQLSRALISASKTSRSWTPSHEKTLHHLLPSSSSSSSSSLLTPSLVSSAIDPHLLLHHRLAQGLFYWAAQQPGFSHTPQTYHSLLKSLSLSRQPNSIHALLKQARTQRVLLPPSSSHLAVSSLLLCNRTIEAAKLVEQVAESNPDTFTPDIYNSLLAALSDDGQWEFAKKLFDEMTLRCFGFNNVGFGVFINGFCRILELAETLRLVEETKRQVGEVDGSLTAALVVDGLCRAGRIEEAWGALEELRGRGCKPDFIAYRIVSEAFKKVRRLEEAGKILKQKRKFGVAPRTDDYKKYILLLISERRILVAKELGEAIVDGDFPIEDDVLNALVGSVSAVDPDSAVSFCMYMIGKGRFPTLLTLSNLSRSLCKAGKTDEMWELYRVLLSNGYFMEVERYNVMISFLCKAGRVREAYGVLKEMKKKGFDPDVSSYNSLLEACCREDLLRPAKRLWDEMFASGCCGNSQTYNTLIRKFSETDDAEEARRLFHRMLEKGVVPDGVTYASLVKVLCRGNRVDDACEIFSKSVEQDLVLAGSVLRTLILCLCKDGNFPAASRVIRGDLPPGMENSDSHVILLKSLADGGLVGKAIEHLEWIRDGSPWKLQTISAELVASFSTAPKLEAVLPLLRAMRERGLVSDEEDGPWMDLM